MAAVVDKAPLTPDEEAELNRLWKLNCHKERRERRERNWDCPCFVFSVFFVANSDFTDEIELAQLPRLHETLPLEIVAVLESLNRLRESPDYELCQISEQKTGVLEERAALLAQESAELEAQANRLAEETFPLLYRNP